MKMKGKFKFPHMLLKHLIKGPHSRDKMLRGLQFIRKKLLRAAIYKKSQQNKLNLIKLYTLGIFWGVRGPHKCIWRATCGPQAACLRPLIWYISKQKAAAIDQIFKKVKKAGGTHFHEKIKFSLLFSEKHWQRFFVSFKLTWIWFLSTTFSIERFSNVSGRLNNVLEH